MISAKKSQNLFLADIQMLRGIAVIAVIIFHSTELMKYGYLGVDIFFVISGFLITPKIADIILDFQTRKNLHKLKIFYLKRFFRITPSLTVTLSISTIIIFFTSNVEEHSRIIKQGLAAILLVGNYGAYEFNGNYFSPNPNPFTHTWSLSLEEQIYLILPILLIVLAKIKYNKYLKVQYCILSLISLSFFIIPSLSISLLNIFSIDDYFGSFSYYSTIHRFWEFGAGGILSLSSWNFRNYRKPLKIFVNIALIALLIKGFSDSILSTILVVLITCLAISSKSLN
jgi:peptidoglycan/LPS O-acetylase OafA/YrhL